jgi:glutathione synthase/RimK-type ligase-like ATP-grasp enzyme
MQTYIVANDPKDWSLKIPGVQVVDARSYLIGEEFASGRGTIIFNLCRSYRYQSTGYYVSLLAAARGHRPLPSISSIQDMKSLTILRYASEDLEDIIQQSLRPLQSKTFTLSVYFGRNIAKRYDRLSRNLFDLFDAPLLRAVFAHDGKWQLQKISPIGASDIPDEHVPFVIESAKAYFSRRRFTVRKKRNTRYDIAMLCNPSEEMPPSNDRALAKFEKAARTLGLEPSRLTKEDYGRLAEFDALFIRETTMVNHHTYRFARRAVAEGLVVIDDPDSILKCTNKVYLAELLERHHIPTPKTVIVHRDNVDSVAESIGFPCILKQPDSSFSQGVFKINDREAFARETQRLLERSDLIIAQQFVRTDFDWRVGVLDRHPLYVCRYYMAPNHWQIHKTGSNGEHQYGRVETLPVPFAPSVIVRTAVRAANLIGDGLYGVDLKQDGRHCLVMEINDNPNLDAGVEDAALKDDLYLAIMQVFLKRIENIKMERISL